MEVVEQPPTEVKSKKKLKKKKLSKLNSDHHSQSCEDEEKICENGISTEKSIETLTEDLRDIHIVKQKNGLKLVNGIHDEIENHKKLLDDKCEDGDGQSGSTKEKSAIGSNNNNSTLTTPNTSNNKKSNKKKKNKKQNSKEPDKNVTEASNSLDTRTCNTNGPTESIISEMSQNNTTTETTCSTPKIITTSTIISSSTEQEEGNSSKKIEPKIVIDYKEYESELQMPDIMQLIQKDLSEPYSIYTYRYFIHNWPKLCFLAMHDSKCVGAIVCKLDMHKMVRRGYIAMLAVDKDYRKMKIGTTLVQKAIEVIFFCLY